MKPTHNRRRRQGWAIGRSSLGTAAKLTARRKEIENHAHGCNLLYQFILCIMQTISTIAGSRLCGHTSGRPDGSKALVKTQGEIEAAVCELIRGIEQKFMGQGPREVHAHLVGNLLVVRLQGVLTASEQRLAKSLAAEKGRDLLKQVRNLLIEKARPIMEAMIFDITGVRTLSLHHDVSTVTGEEVVLFTLAESPDYRRTKKR